MGTGWRGRFKRIADLANQELERRLIDDPEAIATKDLAVVGGIASERIARYKSWGRSRL